MRATSRWRKAWALTAALAITVSGLLVAAPPAPAEALSGAEFDPGYIISDSAFYDANAMSQAEIQAFLDAKIGACANGQCLNIGSFATTPRARLVSDSTGNVRCNAYNPAPVERASAIIFKVQQACGISAKALLITLQKEQALVTSKSPSTAALDRAMGYACPDTGPCTVLGFDAQMYFGALQLNTYKASRFGVQPGLRAVRYHPNAACGSGNVMIANFATAALYNYTPYQPNAAALANLGGQGDGCSSYGNRNFWVFYNNWFGSPTGPRSPFGAMAADPVVGGINFWGWAIDLDTVDPISVHLYVDSVSYGVVANTSRPDVGALYPDQGPLHGFNMTVPASGGFHQACVYGINVGAGVNTLLGCSTVYVPGGSPTGAITSATSAPGEIEVSGWVIDPDVVDPATVHIYVDSASYGFVASKPVPALANSHPAYGPNHGFSVSVPATEGAHQVCAYGINVGLGANSLLGCQSVTVPSTSPFGAMEQAVGVAGGVTFTGWAIDASTTDPISVHVYVNALSYGVVAGEARADIGSKFPDFGANHGFSVTVPAVPGPHTACAYGINVGPGSNTLLGCTTVIVPDGSPIGQLGNVSAGPEAIHVDGWALDPDVTSPISVHVYVDNLSYGYLADEEVPALATSHPGKGTAHGFSATIPTTPGQHNVCLYGINVAGGSNKLLGCRLVTVPSESPFGSFDNASGVAGGIAFSGWAIDPSVVDPISVHLYVDSASYGVIANVPRSDVGTTYPAFGPNHGFEATIPATPGVHRACVYGINVGAGESILIGCKDVVVPGGSPIGQLTSAIPGAGVVNVSGWALDADTVDPIYVHVYVDDLSYGYLASQEVASLATSHPGMGTAHGYWVSVPAIAGSHRVCVYGINEGPGSNVLIDCRSVTVTA